MNFVEELQWRGMLHNSIPETEAHLNAQMRKAYIGFDPTASSLGVGNMVQIMTLLHFQQSGHKPVALIGGATGMVGDPSGKSAERNLLGEEELRYNQECQQKQLERFLDFNCGNRSAEIVNNYDWFKEMGFLDFIRDVGKRLTVNYMMAKDSVKNRISGEDKEGMSFTEFTYQLIQGYDFYYLWKNHGITLQMGGSDQWGNITTGTELIRRIDGGSAFALTTPLIKKADGTKFGKTESGNVWLDAARTSPYKFYQFWLNASDEDVKNFIRIFTLKGKEEIEALEAAHALDPGMRALQKALAEDITTRVHSAADTTQAIQASGILFSKDSAFDSLPKEMLLDIFEGVPQGTVSKTEIEAGADIIDVLVNSGFLPSKGEARRALQENSIAVNKQKVTLDSRVDASHLIHGELIILQRGKKNYFLLKCL
ncbi:MAG: tyrosine--tRNA ligase [Flavobacteriales bacterium]|jgi:tyrosyl-tRNA synthetase|nr:tyrosine--tRNA ligase [Flavobacteriales bacterium]MDP4716295.1 tyrosine--tRNA ligase [Flavobacteriales bacterium]MDP4818226.1 tyrosine--tRNA ligase [Flavobacteriales bacterium]MDP4951663.1 tyrosine--tRNA ligase [Flavobacteriales bacterium]MDP5075184.1 tyrosine--tRNA ligase [Flavobacteriales bacterium]